MKLKTINNNQEEADAVKAYDEAKASDEEAIPFTQALKRSKLTREMKTARPKIQFFTLKA